MNIAFVLEMFCTIEFMVTPFNDIVSCCLKRIVYFINSVSIRRYCKNQMRDDSSAFLAETASHPDPSCLHVAPWLILAS